MANSFSHLIPKQDTETNEDKNDYPVNSGKSDSSLSSNSFASLIPSLETVEDVGRSALTGLRSGVEGLVGLPGDIDKGLSWLVRLGAQKAGIAPEGEDYINRTGRFERPLDLGSSGVRAATESVVGQGYQPKTTAGEFAKTIGQFVPGSTMGPGGMAQKAFSYGVIPAVASETAGQMTKGSEAEPYARLAAALGVSGGTLGATGRFAKRQANKVLDPITGTASPSTVANRRIASAMEKDASFQGLPGYKPLTQQEFQAAQSRGQPVTNLERGGEMTRGLARNAANVSPEARAKLVQATEPRFPTQGERTADFVKGFGGGKDAFASRDALIQEARKVRTPMYQEAYKKGQYGIDKSGLEELQAAPAISGGRAKQEGLGGAMQDAEIRIRNRHAAEASENAALGKSTPPVDFRIQGTKGYTLEFWDAVKQSLDDDINRYFSRGDNGRARELTLLRDRLVNELDEAIPTYKSARGTASTYFNASNALEAGEKFATAGARFKNADAKSALSKMTSREQELFREGYISRMVANAEEAVDRQNLANRLMNSTAARERTNLVLGEKGANELAAQLNVENLMEAGRKEIIGNSQTARWLLEAGITTGGVGVGAYGLYTGDPNALTIAGIIGGRRILSNAAERKVALEIANKLSTANPEAIKEATKQLAKRPAMLSNLNRFLQATLRSSAQTVSDFQTPNRDKKQDSLANKLRNLK